jgi:hypothetical protein
MRGRLASPANAMDVFSETFDRRKNLSIYWYNKASDLRGSAGALWATMHDQNQSQVAEELGFWRGFSFSVACWPVYQMLCGMALELLLKALLVAQGTEPKTVHDLVALSKDAGLHLTEKQEALFEILSEAIIWEGRYPVPKQEPRYRRFAELQWKHLWDPIQTASSLNFRRPNDNLSWQSFDGLWKLIFNVYGPYLS